MVDFTRESYTARPNDRPRSYDSCTTDEGYHTDDKHSSFDAEIPILKSNRTMYVTLFWTQG